MQRDPLWEEHTLQIVNLMLVAQAFINLSLILVRYQETLLPFFINFFPSFFLTIVIQYTDLPAAKGVLHS